MSFSRISSSTFHDILDTKSEFLEVEWLHEIVISSERESLDLVYLLRECREEEKWYLDTTSRQHTDKRESVYQWHHPIYDEEIIATPSYHIEGFFSI